MDIFIDCLLDNDLKQLIISGTAKESELQEAWDKIYVQYCELSQNGTYNEAFEIMKEIDDLRAKITIVNNTIQHLQIGFDAELIELLNGFGLRCTIIEEDAGDVLIDKLNNVIARMKKWFPLLKQKEKALGELRSASAGKTDRAYFDNWLDALSEAKGYHMKASEITVARFCRALIRITEQAEKEQIKRMIHAS